jgi:hypothetical protein
MVLEFHFHKDLKHFAKKVDALAKISEKLKEVLTKNLLPVNIQTIGYQLKHNDRESRKLPFLFLPTSGLWAHCASVITDQSPIKYLIVPFL